MVRRWIWDDEQMPAGYLNPRGRCMVKVTHVGDNENAGWLYGSTVDEPAILKGWFPARAVWTCQQFQWS